jgi:hypothetical protein
MLVHKERKVHPVNPEKLDKREKRETLVSQENPA